MTTYILIRFAKNKFPDGLVHNKEVEITISAPLDDYNSYQDGGFHTITVPPLNTLKDSPQMTHYDSSPSGAGKSSNR